MIETTGSISANEIDRALSRNGIRAGSALEDHIRAHAYDILFGWYSTEPGIGEREADNSDMKMDRYIARQRVNRAYADSFLATESPKERVPISDQAGLLALDIRKILTGEAEVFDDRDRHPR